ncbi:MULTISPECIES: GNAT family N-acetyltransferase [Bacillaceae]|uniref:GNAT family N-acetyltransferase n=1 Tax=Bacillaceae TaxID=186817 RepID=UPI0008ECA04A|nr:MULTISPECIES: GNAT family N-acetyltransferase [Bacillaceae]SFC75139.1 Acetyltransferase (GNAT) domain-containing protein [Bacillus sp. UNCCL81]
MNIKIERLQINFKTLEQFQQFSGYGLQELSMLEDLESNLIDNEFQSPFYGIYLGKALIARMSLYTHSENNEELIEINKMEVLPYYQKNGYGKELVNFAKSFKKTIKTIPRANSNEFWKKQGFIEADSEFVIWKPENK